LRLSWAKGIPNAVTEAEQRCLRQGGEGWSALWAPRVKIGRPSHRQFGDGPSFDAIQCRPMNLISLSHHGKFEISCYKKNYHQVRRTKLLVLSWRSAFMCLTVRGLSGGSALLKQRDCAAEVPAAYLINSDTANSRSIRTAPNTIE
jgi:hypothetical protein